MWLFISSLATVKETLFPSASPTIPQEQPRKWRMSDANSTIFGALCVITPYFPVSILTRSFSGQAGLESPMNPSRAHPITFTFFLSLLIIVGFHYSPTAKFFLSFDSSAAAPVRLLCASSDTPDASSLTLDEIIKTKTTGPPGQFYHTEYALDLLNTLRTIGPSAQVALDEGEASNEQRSHYERFQAKLQAGELVELSPFSHRSFPSPD